MEQKKEILLVVIIPAFNEAATVASVIDGARKPIDGVDSIKVIVIDNDNHDVRADNI